MSSIVPEYAIVAMAGDELAGVAGFRTVEGSFTGGLLAGGPGFRDLVSRLGFLKATETERYPYLRWLLGFGGSTTMVLEVG